MFVVLAVDGYCSLCLNLRGAAPQKIRPWVSFVTSYGSGYWIWFCGNEADGLGSNQKVSNRECQTISRDFARIQDGHMTRKKVGKLQHH